MISFRRFASDPTAFTLKSSKNLTKFCAAVSFALFATSSVYAATLYKWTDKDGVTHYAEHPPTNVTNAEKIRSNVAPGNSPVQYQSPTAQAEAKRQQAAQDESLSPEEQAAKKARCDIARKNLESLNTFVRVREKDENGEIRFLSEEEVNDRKEKFKNVLNKECGGA
ncbi:DUF4124 domain-containing protein [Sessilibacter sp. MAH2]